MQRRRPPQPKTQGRATRPGAHTAQIAYGSPHIPSPQAVQAELGKNEHRPALPDEATKRFFGFLLGSKDYHNEGCSPHELKIKRKVRAFEDRSAFKARRGVFPGESRYHQAGAHDNASYSSYDNDALVSLREQGDWLR